MDVMDTKSKSQVKRERKDVQGFVRTLVGIADSQLKKLPLSEAIMDEIVSARAMTKTALKRQIGYISKRMSDEPVEEAMNLLDRLQKPDALANAHFHQLESWREQLLLDNQETTNLLVDKYQADRQHLRQLIRNVRREQAQNSAPKSARVLFQYLRKLTAA
jgi:ribosome-associated protein